MGCFSETMMQPGMMIRGDSMYPRSNREEAMFREQMQILDRRERELYEKENRLSGMEFTRCFPGDISSMGIRTMDGSSMLKEMPQEEKKEVKDIKSLVAYFYQRK